FAFDIEDFAFAQSEELGDYMELRKLKIHEVSVVEVGANQSTELLAVKERIAQLKNGPLSKSNEGQLREAISLIDDVLSSLDEPDDDDDGNDEDQDTDDQISVIGSRHGTVLADHDGVVQDQAKAGDHPDVALADIYVIAMEGDLS